MSKSLYQVSVALIPGVGVRHVLSDRETHLPRPAASLYEAHLALKTDSHNTRATELTFLASMYAWAHAAKVDLDQTLLTGQGLTAPQIRAFAAWIRKPRAQANGVIPLEKRRSINAAFRAASVVCTWFIKQFASPPSGSNAQRAIEIEMLVEAQKAPGKRC